MGGMTTAVTTVTLISVRSESVVSGLPYVCLGLCPVCVEGKGEFIQVTGR